jgi:hypothetical protein
MTSREPINVLNMKSKPAAVGIRMRGWIDLGVARNIRTKMAIYAATDSEKVPGKPNPWKSAGSMKARAGYE